MEMRAQVLLAMGLLYIVWGSTYLAIRVTVETLHPLAAGGIRFIAAGLLTLAALAALGRLGARPTAAELRGSALAGIWLLVGGVGIVTITEVHAPSNLTAVLASTTSLWVVGYRALAGERIGRGSIAGAALGVVGVIVLLSPGGSGAESPWLIGAVVASLFWSTGSFYGRRLTQPADPFTGAVVQMLCAGVVMTIAGVALDGVGALDLNTASSRSLLALLYLVVAEASRSPPTSGRSSTCRSRRSSAISTSTRGRRAARSGDPGREPWSLRGDRLGLVIAAVFATVRSESSPAPVSEELVAGRRPRVLRALGEERPHDAPSDHEARHRRGDSESPASRNAGSYVPSQERVNPAPHAAKAAPS
jgi:drug/metabolite transporter (DMT)-like permease